ncbi:hypothetical protein ABG775_24010 [Peribacillus simplex]|nr:hypothetical protein [Brevibacillus sp. JNUCC-41]QOS91199.1 hypothetical protein JNUCC41_05480 [Brevibacillus sp. JNUCC-41]
MVTSIFFALKWMNYGRLLIATDPDAADLLKTNELINGTKCPGPWTY